MPLASWGGGNDWSGVFASLADGVVSDLQVQARRLDARHEQEQAGFDAQAYARHEAGRMSDDEWLAYIAKRERETGYDESQQANWIKARLEWTEAIADNRAQAAFDRTGDYGDYIGYLRDKMGSTRDSAGRLAIQEQIRGLTDQHQQQDWAEGAQRLVDRISLGKATQEDFLKYAREARSNLRKGSPLRSSIDQAIAQTQVQVNAQRFDTALAQIDLDPSMKPIERANKIRALANGSTLQTTDPTRYFDLLNRANQLQYMPDPAKVSALRLQLATGEITPDKFQSALYKMSDNLMDYDPQAAFDLRTEAFNYAETARNEIARTQIPNPGALKGYTGGTYAATGGGSGGLNWISQMDGSRYQSLNCTMASGAMMAYAMGYKGLSGGDLRHLTGDTIGGTNIDQLYAALGKGGVDTGGMALIRGGEFEKFTQMVGNGRPVVIVGNNANIPASAKAQAWMSQKHAWLVADYDPQKNSFHIFNSAMSQSDSRSKNGYWVSADIMQSFGFGPGVSGSWLAAPKGTAKGNGKAWHVIDVNTPPMRKETPKSFVGIDVRGAAGNQHAAVRNYGDGQPLTKRSQIEDLQRRDRGRLNQIEEIMRTDTTIDDATKRQLDAEMMHIFDQNIHFSDSLEDFNGVADWREMQGRFIVDAKTRNGDQVEILFNTLIRNGMADIKALQFDPDPISRNKKIAAFNKRVQDFRKSKVVSGDDTEDPLDGVDTDPTGKGPSAFDYLNAVTDALDIAANPDIPLEEKKPILDEIFTAIGIRPPKQWDDPTSKAINSGDANGMAITNVAGGTQDAYLVNNNLGDVIAINGEVTVLQYTGRDMRLDPNTGLVVRDPKTGEEGIPTYDTSNLGDGTRSDELPVYLIPTANGPQSIRAVVTDEDSGLERVVVTRKWEKHEPGYNLTNQDLAKLTNAEVEKLKEQGFLDTAPIQQRMYIRPPSINADGSVNREQKYVQDPDSRRWFMDKLPIVGVTDGYIPGTTRYIGVNAAGDPEMKWYPRATDLGFDVVADPRVKGNEAEAWMNGPGAGYKSGIYRDETGAITTLPQYDDSIGKYSPPSWGGAPGGTDSALRMKIYQAARQERALKDDELVRVEAENDRKFGLRQEHADRANELQNSPLTPENLMKSLQDLGDAFGITRKTDDKARKEFDDAFAKSPWAVTDPRGKLVRQQSTPEAAPRDNGRGRGAGPAPSGRPRVPDGSAEYRSGDGIYDPLRPPPPRYDPPPSRGGPPPVRAPKKLLPSPSGFDRYGSAKPPAYKPPPSRGGPPPFRPPSPTNWANRPKPVPVTPRGPRAV